MQPGDYIIGLKGTPYRVCLVTEVNNSIVEFIYLNGQTGKILNSCVRLATEKEIKEQWI